MKRFFPSHMLLALTVALTIFAGVTTAQVGNGVPSAQVRDFKPLIDNVLRNPSADDWIAWRGSSMSLGYSALNQINRQSVNQLQLQWGWAMDPGNQEATPLVYNGVMFLPGPTGNLQALDAATGDLIWAYSYEPATPYKAEELAPGRARFGGHYVVNRGLSIYGDKVFVNEPDAYLVAVDMRTGKEVWKTKVADASKGWGFGAGSIVTRGGKVISGLVGCERYNAEKCAIVAHEANTGKELWRVETIARKGTPGGDTWGEVPDLYRAGTDAWIPGSYDPDLNLIYWATSQPKPWARVSRGTDGDALYSNCVLAIDPETGKIVWFKQLLPGESHDMDEVFENVLVDYGGRKALFKMGKLAVLWELDRRTGAFVRASDVGYQNLVKIEPRTGKVTYNPGKLPAKVGETVDFCPSTTGFKSLRAMAYSPETQAFYVPLELTCQRGSFVEVKWEPGGGGLGGGRSERYMLPAGEGNLGEFLAMSISGQVLWRHKQRAPYNTAALTTAGGLAFVGDWNRYIYAYDVKTGERLWQTRSSASASGFPISYAVRGRQYVAIPVGSGAGSWATGAGQFIPEMKRPNTGNAIMVFALPESGTRGARQCIDWSHSDDEADRTSGELLPHIDCDDHGTRRRQAEG